MISFIIPFRSDEPERIRSFKYVHSQLVTGWPDAEVIISEGDWEHEPFNRSRARNFGAKNAHGDILVFVDADSWVPEDTLAEAIASIGLNAWVFPYDTYYALSERGSEEALWKSPHWVDLEPLSDYIFPGPDPFDRPPAVGGCIVVHRNAFEEVCGYDERFIGWGFEDRAFVLALSTLCGPEKRIQGPLCHFWHPEPEEERFRQPGIGHNRDLYAAYGAAKGFPERMRALVQEH